MGREVSVDMRSGGERGSVLVLALLILMVLGSLLLLILTIGSMESQISANLLRGSHALSLAEAGLERALAQMIASPLTVSTAPTSPAPLYDRELLGAFGHYSVSYHAIGPDTILVESTGAAQRNAERLLRAVITRSFVPSTALLAERAIVLTGSARVEGERGNVHSNGALSLTAGVSVEGQATASGSFTGEEATIGGKRGSGYPKQGIPSVDLQALRSMADFILGETTILEVSSGAIHPSGWLGWEAVRPGEWRNGGSEPPNGIYVASESILIDGSPGTSFSPWKATLIAGGEVRINGSSVMVPASQDLLIASGRTIRVEGDSVLTGLAVSNEMIELGGRVNLNGSAVSSGEIRVRDDVVLKMDGPLRNPFRVAPWVLAWALPGP